ncbi:MAG: protein translocase subunit SecD [Anaerolineales bacterium]|nr:protein translocase subunit SecD [Anaerolineales bacterium]
MRRNRQLRMLILIIAIVAVAIWFDLPNNPGIHVFGIDKAIETRLGLDLVGGVQALLEADLPQDVDIDAEAMNTARTIVENRVNGLGVSEAVVQQAGDRRIVVELPGETDPEKALAILRQTGLLEFVDMSDISVDQAIALVGTKIETDFAQGSEAGDVLEDVPVFPTVITGTGLENVGVTTNQAGEYEVAFELKPEEAVTFADYTTNNVGSVLAIILDKEVISVPTINSAITDGQGVISGSFTPEEANALAVQLRYGSLPIPLKIVETRTIGPSLGQDSLQKSALAGGVGFTIVILFMALYYRLPGIIADVAIVIYAILAFALFRYIPITLTLAGIAGFLLSTGSALDANILIFERLKEELRSGRTIQQSVDIGWRRAWPSIRDSNIATLITCTILFWFGSQFGATIVKGFSLTLGLGVLVSLFSAIVISRTLLSLVLEWLKPTNYARWFGI